MKTQSRAVYASRNDENDFEQFPKEPSDSNDGCNSIEHGQAKKSIRGMPWHQEPTKDVAIYDKPR